MCPAAPWVTGSDLKHIQNPLFLFLNHNLCVLFPLCHALSEKGKHTSREFPNAGQCTEPPGTCSWLGFPVDGGHSSDVL